MSNPVTESIFSGEAHNSFVYHPGYFVREELKTRGWSQSDLAWVIGCPAQSINLLVNEKKGISPCMAKSLGAALSVRPELFTKLQQSYELYRAKKPCFEISKRAQLKQKG